MPEAASPYGGRGATLWRRLVEGSADLVVVQRPDVVLDVGLRLCESLGWDRDAVVGSGLAPLLEPSDRARFRAMVDDLLGGSVTGGGRRDRFRIRHGDGSWRSIEVAAWPLPAQRRPDAIVLSLNDVTESAERGLSTQRRAHRFKAMVEQASDIIVMLDASGSVKYVSPSVESVLGYPATEDRPVDVFSLIHPDDAAMVREDFEKKVSDLDYSQPITFRLVHRDGGWRWVEALGSNLLHDPDVEAILVNLRDVTQRVEAEQALRAGEERYRRVVEVSPEAVAIHQDGLVTYINPAGLRLLGAADAADIVGRPVADFLHPDSEGAARPPERAGSDDAPPLVEERLVGVDGRTIEVELAVVPTVWDGAPAVQVVARDITDRRHAEAQLAHQATHDALTGLPNRGLLLDRLGQAIARSDRSDQPFAVLFLDLDRFKVVNDGLGHEAGDALLVAVAARLCEAVRSGDTVARLGGDEFVVLAEDLGSGPPGEALVRRIETALAEPVRYQDHDLHVTASIGLVVGDGDRTPGDLLRDADAAMYVAKDQGRARCVRFSESLRQRAASRLAVEQDLRRGLDNHEIVVELQPEVRLADGRPVGAEVLARWDHPTRGVLAPDHFIAVAEESGLITRLGQSVLAQALAELLVWREQGLPSDLWMGVNVSAPEFSQPSFARSVRRLLRDFDIPAGALCMEITESVLFLDPMAAAKTIGSLRSAGVSIAVDDFGTGYSSLSYLKRFPLDFVKIDRSFVRELGRDRSDTAIVRAVVEMSHSLGLAVVAEGVETDDQRRLLLDLGCEYAQGWLFGRPAAPADARSFLARDGGPR